MRGLELCRRYFERYGTLLLDSDTAPYVTVGLVGNGSECFGYDDDVSQDHDFHPAFCLWVDDGAPAELFAELCQRYRALPSEFLGFRRQELTDGGEQRRGVLYTSDFYRSLLGLPKAPSTLAEWLSVPDYALATAANGEIFAGNGTDFTYIRNTLKNGMPRDVRLKRIARHLALMAQAGQYNYARCLKHGEPAAARLALSEFATAAASAVYHLNGQYPPFYKWLLRGLRDLPCLSEVHEPLTELLMSINTVICTEKIEEVCYRILTELRRRELTEGREEYLDIHARRVMEKIREPSVRSLHVMA